MEEAKTDRASILVDRAILKEARILAVTNGQTLKAFTEEALSIHIRAQRGEMTTNTTTANTTNTNKGK